MKDSDLVDLILKFKALNKGLMSQGQYLATAREINKTQPANLLIFGLGEDANIWKKINNKGRTVFLEDDKDWIKKFTDQSLEIYDVFYDTKSEDHENIGFDSELLKMNLPEQVKNTTWDTIFVDGPLGHNPPRPYKGPGRMKSIYTAHSLLKTGGTCIIDDMGRLIESKYAFHFFGRENMHNLVENKIGIFTKKQK